jgi:hypothetical protein
LFEHTAERKKRDPSSQAFLGALSI